MAGRLYVKRSRLTLSYCSRVHSFSKAGRRQHTSSHPTITTSLPAHHRSTIATSSPIFQLYHLGKEILSTNSHPIRRLEPRYKHFYYHQGTLYIVSDGSSGYNKGSYGCSIADSTSTIYSARVKDKRVVTRHPRSLHVFGFHIAICSSNQPSLITQPSSIKRKTDQNIHPYLVSSELISQGHDMP